MIFEIQEKLEPNKEILDIIKDYTHKTRISNRLLLIPKNPVII